MRFASLTWFLGLGKEYADRYGDRVRAHDPGCVALARSRRIDSGGPWEQWLKDDLAALAEAWNNLPPSQVPQAQERFPINLVADLSIDPGGRILREAVVGIASHLADMEGQFLGQQWLGRHLAVQVLLLLPNRVLDDAEMGALGALVLDLHWYLHGQPDARSPEILEAVAGRVKRVVLLAPGNRDDRDNREGFVVGVGQDEAMRACLVAETLLSMSLWVPLKRLEEDLAPGDNTGIIAPGVATIAIDVEGSRKTLAAHRLADLIERYLQPLPDRLSEAVVDPLRQGGLSARDLIRGLLSGTQKAGEVRIESILARLHLSSDGMEPPTGKGFLDWSRRLPWVMRIRQQALWNGPFLEATEWLDRSAQALRQDWERKVREFIDGELGALPFEVSGDSAGRRWARAREAAEWLRIHLDRELEALKHMEVLPRGESSDRAWGPSGDDLQDLLREGSLGDRLAREVGEDADPEPYYQELERFVQHQPLPEALIMRSGALGVSLGILAGIGVSALAGGGAGVVSTVAGIPAVPLAAGELVLGTSVLSGWLHGRVYRRRIGEARDRLRIAIANQVRARMRQEILDRVRGVLAALRAMVPRDDEEGAQSPDTETCLLNRFRERLTHGMGAIRQERYSEFPVGLESPFFQVLPIPEDIGFRGVGRAFRDQQEMVLEEEVRSGVIGGWREMVRSEEEDAFQQWVSRWRPLLESGHDFLRDLGLTKVMERQEAAIRSQVVSNFSRAAYPFSGLDQSIQPHPKAAVFLAGTAEDESDLRPVLAIPQGAKSWPTQRRDRATILRGALALQWLYFPGFKSAVQAHSRRAGPNGDQARDLHVPPELGDYWIDLRDGSPQLRGTSSMQTMGDDL